MQVKKEDIKEKILRSARRAFLEHGYADASLRAIAEDEGLTKGAVYSYFKNKDDLFHALTAPAVAFIEGQFQHEACCFVSETGNGVRGAYEMTVQSFKSCARTVLDYFESFKLLLFCAAGSSLQNYQERVIQLYAQNFSKLLSFFTGRKTCREGVISEMFIHTLANTYISFLEEIVLHEPDRNEVNDYAVQMAVFVHSGIERLYVHQTQ